MSIHDGHRKRIKERFSKHGLDSFEPHQVLELLLFYCVPRRDTNEIAHRLIERFGSFNRVLDAPVYELETVEGMGKNSAEFIAIIKDVCRKYQMNSMMTGSVLNTIEQCGEYLTGFLTGKTEETVCLLCLDAKAKVLECRVVGEGGVNSVNISIRKVLEAAIATKATSVVLAHNHPSGIASPSAEDIQTTFVVAKALKSVDVMLVDHMIITGTEYVSFVHSGLYSPESVL